jgi:hypothetical protein
LMNTRRRSRGDFCLLHWCCSSISDKATYRQAAARRGGQFPNKALLGGTLSALSICGLERRRDCGDSCSVSQNSS